LGAARAIVADLLLSRHLNAVHVASWVKASLSTGPPAVKIWNLELIPILVELGGVSPDLRFLVCGIAILDRDPEVRQAAMDATSFKGFEVQCRAEVGLPKWLGLPPFLSERG
jgi:hypothetical protein